MYKYLFFFFVCIFFFSFSQGGHHQYGNNDDKESDLYGKISGTIKDSETKSALSYASISLFQFLNETDEKTIINGTISNEKGYFVFDNLTTGEYVVEITYNGYVSTNINCKISRRVNCGRTGLLAYCK